MRFVGMMMFKERGMMIMYGWFYGMRVEGADKRFGGNSYDGQCERWSSVEFVRFYVRAST